MISYEEALSIVLANVHSLSKIRCKLNDILGSVLGESIVATYDLPHFDSSAVDGFAVSLADVQTATDAHPVSLPIVSEIRAGYSGNESLKARTTLKIFTGAPVPLGVDAVIMKENCVEINNAVQISKVPKMGENIRRRGEEFLRGQEIIPEGIRINPAMIGLLASLGQASFMVHKKPTVAIVVTGNELVKPGKTLSAGKIFDSNGAALKAACKALYVEDFLPLECKEDYEETKKVLALAMDFADVVITAGGISVGDHDYVKQAFEELGVKSHFYKVAIKPGKPVYFGTATHRRKHKTQYVFGLPGNPVSALLTFNQFVKPAIMRLMGQGSTLFGQPLTKLKAKLGRTLKKQIGRTEFVRAVINAQGGELVVHPTAGQDSHMLGGLSLANGLIVFPSELEMLSQGNLVEVEILNWYN